jgi:hypothetical protein
MTDHRNVRLPRAERDRIAQARAEVAETTITPRVARAVVVVFLLSIAAPHVAQLGLDPSLYLRTVSTPDPASAPVTRTWTGGVVASNRALLARFQTFEDRLADESAIGRYVRPVVQDVMTGWLDAGTAQVEIGANGWLFYRPDIDHVTGRGFLSPGVLESRAAGGDTVAAARQPDPRPALLDLRDQLERRGIALIVMPTPVKPSVESGRIRSPLADTGVVTNRSYARFRDELSGFGVVVFDVPRILEGIKREGAESLYLKTDTHWRPETMTRVASALAALIETTVALTDLDDRDDQDTHFRGTPTEVANQGDTAALLGLGSRQRRYPPETVRVERVETTAGKPWNPDPEAEILLLGDSFSNVYSMETLGWGESAGLAEQLSLALDRPVDRLSQNDGGAVAPRRLLATALARDAARLSRVRVVIYQFATRELSQGDWRPVELGAAASPTDLARWSPAAFDAATVEATVASIGTIPRPGTVPYRDHIVALHLTNIEVVSGSAAGNRREAVVYARSMIDNVLTEIANYQPGDAIALRLEPWATVAGSFDGINRAELEDPALLLAVPWWGTPLTTPP